MDFKRLLKKTENFVEDLWDIDMPGEEKHQQVTDFIVVALERADDLVAFLPGGLGVVAKNLVDNEAVDALERTLAHIIAETLFQRVLAQKSAA